MIQEFCVNCVSYGDDNNKRNLKSLITSLFHLSASPTPLGLGSSRVPALRGKD